MVFHRESEAVENLSGLCLQFAHLTKVLAVVIERGRHVAGLRDDGDDLADVGGRHFNLGESIQHPVDVVPF